MALARWDPANYIDQLQSDFNRFFEGFLPAVPEREHDVGLRRCI